MATIEVNKKDLEKLVGKKLDDKKLEDELFDLKLELDKKEEDTLFIELEYDRADLLTTEGIARQMRGHYGIETGLQEYDFEQSDTVVEMSKELEKYRPYAEYFIALSYPMNEDSVKQLMQVQEKLHEVYARERTLASIGIYDLDKTSKQFKYEARKPNEIKFIPLEKTKEMTGEEILEKHEKGKEYKHLIEHLDKYPLLMDSNGKVLSMPPIINSENTKVDEKTENLFVDVTGTSKKTVSEITILLATFFAERGAKIKKVKVKQESKERITPKIEYKEMNLKPDEARRTLGLNLDNLEMIRLLKKQRFGARQEEGFIKTTIPPYRIDIIHPIDLIEEISCAYGLNNMKPSLPNIATIGELHKTEKKTRKAREAMIGLGFQEIASFITSNKERMFEKPIELLNPVTEEHNCLRNSLMPKLMEFFQANKHYELPQKIFEAGEAVTPTNKGEAKTRTETRIAGAVISRDAGYTEIKSICEALLKTMNKKAEFKEIEKHYFIPGRAAEIIIKNKKIGELGEIHPEILEKFQLENPVALFEINLEKID